MLNFMLWVIVGGSAGWLANRLLRPAAHRKTGLNILTGIEGAALGGLVLSPLFGVNPISRTPSVPALLIALGVAFLLLGGVNWFWRPWGVVARNGHKQTSAQQCASDQLLPPEYIFPFFTYFSSLKLFLYLLLYLRGDQKRRIHGKMS